MRRLTIASPWLALAIFLGCVAGAACHDGRVPQSATTPTGPTASTTVEPPKFYTLGGQVYDSFYDGLVDVPVEVVDGPLTGTIARTDRHGSFKLPGEFSEEITVRASKEGLSSATRRVTLPQMPMVGNTLHVALELTPLSPPADIAGPYTFTVETTACAGMPESLRVRDYSVTVVPHTNAFSFRMKFSDPAVVEGWGDPTVEIRIMGSRIQMNIGDWGAGIIEDFPSAWLTFFGFTQATIADSGVSGSFGGSGGLMYCPAPRRNPTSLLCPENNSSFCEGDLRYSLRRR